MDKTKVNYKGERLSFFKLFTDKKWNVEIPIIQRDYAQGRRSSKDIREDFLDTLNQHLASGSQIDLDFVYGSLDENNQRIFIPLDGQQRLTTLFLLHWFLAYRSKQVDAYNDALKENKRSKFTYETRTSSRDFCDALLLNSIDFENFLPADINQSNSLSKTIRDSNWYFRSWDYDPTIQSMLTMLDAINEKFVNTDGYFDQLVGEDPTITFQFLNLREFKLTDDLYIKMNARGKQLTPFENFKAKFEKLIKETPFENEYNFQLERAGVKRNVSVVEYFSHQIDTEWANLFWNYKDDRTYLYDDQLMNFFRVIITNNYALKERDQDLLENLKTLMGKDDPERTDIKATLLSYSQYSRIGAFDEKLIIDIIYHFDFLKNGENKIKTYLANPYYFDETRIFVKAINNILSYTERLQFFAFYQYFISEQPFVELENWIRVIFNLTENTIYNRPAEFSRSIQSIQSMLPHAAEILNYFAEPQNAIDGFFEIAVKEERIKAILILKNNAWRVAILDIEKHGYFRGQIGFLLDFSGIDAYYTTNGNCSWTDEEDSSFFESFNINTRKARAVFDVAGLMPFKQFFWERALLAKGNYLTPNRSNLSFLVDNDREISWKRLLRDENDGRRAIVRDLFDDPLFIEADVNSSLKKIIRNSQINDWRKFFIELPEVLQYLGTKKYIRHEGDDKINLLKKERINGLHAEYYSYAFFLKYQAKAVKPFEKIWYYDVSTYEEIPCCVLDSWKRNKLDYRICISKAELGFEVEFAEVNDKKIQDDISQILEKDGFKLTAKYYSKSAKSMVNAIKIVDKLCSELSLV